MRRRSEVPDVMDPDEMNLSLNGCGYLGIYHVGVCSCIKEYYPQALRGKISGGSVGALVACAFMCDVPLDICAKYVFDVSMQVRNGILGPMSPDLNIMKVLYESMDAMLPEDAHVHCDGKLNVSVTRFETGKNVLLNRFKSREELLQALMCSCFIPIYCGYEPPEFYGVAYVDAAMSNNSPWLNKYTVTVAPFSGNSDICPENDGKFLKSLTLSNTSIGLTAKNMYMLFRVLFPASPDIQKDICQQGYNDAARFLRNKGLIPCPDCECKGPKPDHSHCNLPENKMPVEISNEIEKAILGFQRNLGYRLLQYKSMKWLYYLNMPSIVTAKVAYVLLSSILQKVNSKAGLAVDDIWSNLKQALMNGLYRPGCQFEIKNEDLDNEGSETTSQISDTDLESDDRESGIATSIGDEVLSDSDTSISEAEIPVPESQQSKYLNNAFPIAMTSGQACNLESSSACENIDSQVKEQRKTYVY